jgi:TPR repeat protein
VISENAGRGHAGAQAHLCILYTHAAGVPQDYVEAAAWYGRLTDPAAAKFALDAIMSHEDSERPCGAIGGAVLMAKEHFPDFLLTLLCSSF